MRQRMIFRQVAALFMIVFIAGAYSVHRYFVDRAVEKTKEEALIALTQTIKKEIDLVVLGRMHDVSADRSDIDFIIRGITRMRMLDRLRSQAWNQETYESIGENILTEVGYLAPKVYKYGDRQTFLVFVDTLRSVGLTPDKAGLGADYWVALNDAK